MEPLEFKMILEWNLPLPCTPFIARNFTVTACHTCINNLQSEKRNKKKKRKKMKGLAERKGIKLQCRLPLPVIFQQQGDAILGGCNCCSKWR